jgi:hydroxyethylthiazole kinase-like sugar kinase family protein
LKIKCPNTPGVVDGFGERQQAMDAMIAACQKNKICSACTASAALYVAATVAVQRLDSSEKEFLEMALDIFKDTKEQVDIQLRNTNN